MGFLGFGGGNAAVQLLLDRQDVAAGGSVQATVRVAGGRKDTPIDEGRLRLICENEYEWREETRSFSSGSSSSTTSTSTRRDTDRKVVQEERFLEPGAVSADTPSEHTLTVEIPEHSTPSAEGKITRVRWKVQATLARSRTRDISDEVQLEVLSTTDPAWVEPDAEVDSRGDYDLALTPSADCKVNEVRVELEREENVPRGKGNEERVREAQAIVAGEVELTPGLPIEYPFRLEVPPDPVATLQTDQSTVRWRLKGIGSRRMRRDYDVAQELYVYSAPGAHLG